MDGKSTVVERLIHSYLDAKRHVLRLGFADEISWQESVSINHLSEATFMREYAWVVLSSGMRESVVRSVFPRITDSFLRWASASLITWNRAACRAAALRHFRHRGKIDAILGMARYIDRAGFAAVTDGMHASPVEYLQGFSFMGPATARHLAKNLGIDVVKPDRHLKRLAAHLGYHSPDELCEQIASVVRDSLCVVDLVLWRYATLNPDYLDFFGHGSLLG